MMEIYKEKVKMHLGFLYPPQGALDSKIQILGSMNANWSKF